MKITIVGYGFVGRAVEYGFRTPKVRMQIVDPKYGKTCYNSLKDVNLEENITFVCVPTPMNKDGSIDSTILVDTVKELKERMSGIIVIKSTVTPDIIKKLVVGSGGTRIVYNPEFLTEKNAIDDFINPDKHIFGGNDEFIDNLEFYYKEYSLCRPCPVHRMSAVDASFVKYGINSFLAMKVLFFNQLYDVVENNEAAYNKIVNAITSDSRIGRSHSAVPGLDNKRGYGGACFPKDTSALFNLDKGFTLLGECVRINNEYRSQYELDQREIEQHVDYGQTEEKQ
jgi:nucleotide sugar dehydrogenase